MPCNQSWGRKTSSHSNSEALLEGSQNGTMSRWAGGKLSQKQVALFHPNLWPKSVRERVSVGVGANPPPL